MADKRADAPATGVPGATEHFQPSEADAIEAPDTGGGSYGAYGFSGDFGETTPYRVKAEYAQSDAPREDGRAKELGEPDDPDAVLRAAVVDALSASDCDCRRIYVSASDGVVELSGSAPTPETKQQVLRIASKVPGVRAVRSSMERAADEPSSDRVPQ